MREINRIQGFVIYDIVLSSLWGITMGIMLLITGVVDYDALGIIKVLEGINYDSIILVIGWLLISVPFAILVNYVDHRYGFFLHLYESSK